MRPTQLPARERLILSLSKDEARRTAGAARAEAPSFTAPGTMALTTVRSDRPQSSPTANMSNDRALYAVTHAHVAGQAKGSRDEPTAYRRL